MAVKKEPTKSNVSKEELLGFYREMLLIRRFEEKAGQLYGMGLIGGFCHLYIGQEAVVVGLEACTKAGDKRITDQISLLDRQQAFGYTFEDLRMLMVPMARDGVEVSGRTQLNPHWRTQASYNYIQATYQEGFSSLAGKSLPSIPARQFFSSLQWSQKGFAPAAQAPRLGMEVSLDWMARAQIWATDQNTPGTSAPGFGVFNMRVRQRYQVGTARVEAFVGIDNLTNKDTIGSVIINQKALRYFEPGLERNWVVGVQSHIPL